MDFRPTPEQTGFAQSVTDLMDKADPVAAARAWAAGDHAPGLALWRRLAELGVNALLVPSQHGGLGASAADLVIAFEVLGHQLAVGPWTESAAYLPLALPPDRLGALAEGAVATVAVPPHVPFALDADVAGQVYAVSGDRLAEATVGDVVHPSVDTTRRLFDVATGGTALDAGDLGRAFDLAALGTAAELLGCGERLLAETVAYAQQRRQYGRVIGSYQALKHRLADVRIALDFARPLVHGAAVSASPVPACSTTDRARAVSAAKVAAGDAAYLASRVALQVHGAVGYTAELDLSLWILRVRALVGAWGSSGWHRARIAESLGAA